MSIYPPKSREKFAMRLRNTRMAAGLSQRELGRRIGLLEEVVSSRVARYELGTSEPDFATVERLATALGVPSAWLLTDDATLAEIILAASRLSPERQRQLVAELNAEIEKSGTKKHRHPRAGGVFNRRMSGHHASFLPLPLQKQEQERFPPARE
jgi:transcriptional regulator with XRE-family HTH domain